MSAQDCLSVNIDGYYRLHLNKQKIVFESFTEYYCVFQ